MIEFTVKGDSLETLLETMRKLVEAFEDGDTYTPGDKVPYGPAVDEPEDVPVEDQPETAAEEDPVSVEEIVDQTVAFNEAMQLLVAKYTSGPEGKAAVEAIAAEMGVTEFNELDKSKTGETLLEKARAL